MDIFFKSSGHPAFLSLFQQNKLERFIGNNFHTFNESDCEALKGCHLGRRHDTHHDAIHHNDTQHNNTQHNSIQWYKKLNVTPSIMTLRMMAEHCCA